ncbi:phosphotransferase [Cellulomonas sp. DKR-3]|uniref:Phosphotransferase n=1 Tax=Cellulomonas fulva TaxID=2835530 RepID=A0ABS5TXH3_9CELL|nr:phosphotransferase [Cellulomonas fulva]MBT0993855.1 phosphotransferase [Cellulomonas fulva]
MTPAGLAPHDPAPTPGPGVSPGDLPAGAVGASGEVEPPDPATHPHASPGGTEAHFLATDEPGPLLTSGSRADVYVLDDDTVLRRYRDGQDAAREVEILRHVVAQGFPAPAVYAAQGPDLVMERLHGPTLLQALAAGEVGLAEGAQLLVDLHDQLHAIAAPGAAPGADGLVVLHLDLHPGNVILTEQRGPAVVDWANARAGAATLDVAVTALVLAEVAVDAGGAYSQAARALLAAFLTHGAVSPLPALDAATEVRRTDPGFVTEESALVDAAADLVRDLLRVAG